MYSVYIYSVYIFGVLVVTYDKVKARTQLDPLSFPEEALRAGGKSTRERTPAH